MFKWASEDLKQKAKKQKINFIFLFLKNTLNFLKNVIFYLKSLIIYFQKVWWHMPINPGTWKDEAGVLLQIQGQPGLHRSCLKKPT